MDANGVNYYKGVLLCSRPNENPSLGTEKPFCARVTPPESLGLQPTKHYESRKVKKRVLPVLKNHKKWLLKFQHQVEEKKKEEKQQELKDQKLKEKVKQEAQQLREKILKGEEIPDQPTVNQNKQFYSKAFTKKEEPSQVQAKKVKDLELDPAQEQEMDDLLQYFQSTEVKDYSNDQSVKKMLADLKERINKMRTEGDDWKEQQMHLYREEIKKPLQSSADQNDDILSRVSKNSATQSIASQKTVSRVQELEKKKKEKEWDKLTVSDKKVGATVQEQIAKNVADQVLRNYPMLKHHSNLSIRRLLQKQAKAQLISK